MSEQTDKKADVASENQGSSRKKRGFLSRFSNRAKITMGVVVCVIVLGGGGFYVWHEQPSFCGAICHSPMDPYLATYESEPGEATTDKYGNEVSDASSMLSAVHRSEAGITCLQCHGAVLSDQIDMGINWVIGNYDDPITEHSTTGLPAASEGDTEDEFCLNEACHNMTRDDLVKATSSYGTRNPHVTQHVEFACSDCHKAHRQSVMLCTECHDDAVVPDGWITNEENKAIEEAAFSEEES